MSSRLAQAVLQHALSDACGLGADMLSRKPGKAASIAEGRLFWAATEGAWAEARRMWCDAAGICERMARQQALARIASVGGNAMDGRAIRASFWKQRDDEIERLWRSGLTYPQVAEAMSITEHTVKAVMRKRKRRA